jgi:hypothetical protein
MNARGTRVLRLITRVHCCQNGPMAGETVVLSEYSPNSAWLEINGRVGRYVLDEKQGRLVWEDRHDG